MSKILFSLSYFLVINYFVVGSFEYFNKRERNHKSLKWNFIENYRRLTVTNRMVLIHRLLYLRKTNNTLRFFREICLIPYSYSYLAKENI